MLMNSIVLNNNMMMMRMNPQGSSSVNHQQVPCQQQFCFPYQQQQQQQEMIQSNNYFTSLLLNESKTSLDEVQINSPLFLKLDIDDLLQTLQDMNTVNNQEMEQQLPTTPSSTLNTSTDM